MSIYLGMGKGCEITRFPVWKESSFSNYQSVQGFVIFEKATTRKILSSIRVSHTISNFIFSIFLGAGWSTKLALSSKWQRPVTRSRGGYA